MPTNNTFRSISITIVLTLAFFSGYSAVFAQNCTTPPDYKGPFASLFSDPSKDCTNNYVNYDELTVTCLNHPSEVMEVLGDEEFLNELDNTHGDGSITLNFDNLTNIVLDPETHQQELDQVSPGKTQLISYSEYYDPCSYAATCVDLGLDTWPDCYQHFNDTLVTKTGRERENILATQNTLNVSTTNRQQYQRIKDRCDNIINSYQGDAAPPEREHIYWVSDNQSSYQTCQQLPDWEEYQALSPQEMLPFCVENRKSQRHAYLVFDPIPKDPFISLQNPTVQIIQVPIDGLVAAYEGFKQNYQLNLTLKQQLKDWDQMEQTVHPPPKPANIITHPLPGDLPTDAGVDYQKLIDLINQTGNACDTEEQNPMQFYGAVKPVQVLGSAIFSWFINLIDAIQAATDPYEGYRGWLLVPEQYAYLEQMSGISDSAVMRTFLTLYQQSIIEKTDIPQLLSTDSTVKTDEKKYVKEYETRPCPEPNQLVDCQYPVYESISGRWDFSDLALNFPAGSVVNTFMINAKRVFEPLHGQERFDNDCYYPQLEHRIGSQLGGFSDLADSAGAANFTANCNDFSPLPRTDSPDTCYGDDSELISASNACQLNLSNFNGYLNNFGINGLPQLAQDIINSSAQTHNVKANLILGLLMTEGSFQNSNWDWSDSMVQEASVCGGQVPSCTANSAGALGPYQIIPKWHPNFEGDPCNFYDSTMYVASQLARQKYGGPPEFYALTVGLYGDESTDNGLTCNGISYNTQGSPASTCTNWSIEDVATAYRLHRGICDTVSQTRFINIFQGKAPE